MKILHVNDVAHVSATLVEGLNKLGHAAELRRLRLVAGRKSTAMKLLAAPLRLQEWASVNRQVKRGSYDIVHIHFAYLGWLGILGRYPYYLHVHGSDVRRDLKDPLRRGAIIESLKRAHKVLFVTPDLAPIVRAFRPEAIFLPDPVNTQRFQPAARRAGGPPKILIISWLSPVKGVSVAFAAVEKLRQTHPDVEVTAIDSGPERERYQGAPGVRMIAPVPYERMPELIHAHDIVLGQFGIGSLGMSELESLACARPVVCYADAQTGYADPPPVFSTKDEQKAAGYLAALVEDPSLRQQAGQRSREWVERCHGYLNIARQLEQIYLSSRP